ncbi:MAG: hypothetical protein SGBAC_010935, partial [Bacillariaceae sp.]
IEGPHADYTEQDQSSYSESDNGKRSPYSEYITEYTDETDDDKMSATLGISRNQYCSTLNALVEGSESSSSESSYSQSTFASDFDRMCNANVNTSCMSTLFNRNIDVPGTIHCEGEHAQAQQKGSLPLPLHYMDYLVPSKQDLNSALDNFTQKFDTGDEERPGFPQVYKSLFEGNLSQTASSGDENRIVDNAPRRKGTERNRSKELGFTKAKQEVFPKVEKDNKDPDILAPPSHIVIKDDFTAVSSAESFGFAPETQKASSGMKHSQDRREGDKSRPSPRHAAPRRPSPRHTVPHRPSPSHSIPERPSPRHTVEKKHEHSSTKADVPATTRHGLNRLMQKQAPSTSKRRDIEKEERLVFDEQAGVKSPLSGGRVSANGKSNVFSFRHMDETRQDTNASEHLKSNKRREGAASHQQLDRRDPGGLVEEESPSFDERLVPIKASVANAKASRIENQIMINSKVHPLQSSSNKTPIMNDERNGMAGEMDADAMLWGNPANYIPRDLCLKPTQTAISELTGEVDDFGETKIQSTQLEARLTNPQGNGAVNVQVLSLKPTQTAVSELTCEAGDFEETRGYSVPLDTILASPRGTEIPPTTATTVDGFKMQSREERTKATKSPLAVSEMRVQSSSRRNKDMTNGIGVWKSNNSTPIETPKSGPSIKDHAIIRRTTPTKKAETLEKFENALTGSRKSFTAEYSMSKRQGLKKTQLFTFDEPRFDARLAMEGPEITGIGNDDQKLESSITRVEGEETKTPSNDIMSKPRQQKLDDAVLARQAEPFDASTPTLESTEEKRMLEKDFEVPSERDKDKRNVRTDTIEGAGMNAAQSLYPESFSDYCKEFTDTRSAEDRDYTRDDNATQNFEEDDPTSLSALDNEISLLESQITGLKQQDHISDIHNDQMTAANHHLEPKIINDATEIDGPFFFVFIVETRKFFSDILFIIVAWLRHLSSIGKVHQQQGGGRVRLMGPPIAEDDVLFEQQLQSRPLVLSRLPSPASEEPGIVVESFIPEMWTGHESIG